MATIGSMTVMLKAENKEFRKSMDEAERITAKFSTGIDSLDAGIALLVHPLLRARNAISAMAEKVKETDAIMGGYGKTIVQTYGAVGRLGMATGKFFAKHAGEVKNAITQVAKWGTLLAGAASAGAAYLMGTVMKSTDEMVKFADAISISVERLQVLEQMASLAGVNTEKFRAGFEKMILTISKGAEGEKSAADLFERLGLSAKALATMNPEDQFLAIADAIDKIGNSADKLAVVREVFGKSGSGFLNVMRGGSVAMKAAADEAARLGIILTRMDIAKIEAANDAVERMQTSLSRMLAVFASGFAPYITVMADKVTAFVKSLDIRAVVAEWVPAILNLFARIYVGVQNIVMGMLDLFSGAMDAIPDMFKTDSLKKSSEYMKGLSSSISAAQQQMVNDEGAQDIYDAWAIKILKVTQMANKAADQIATEMESAVKGRLDGSAFDVAKLGGPKIMEGLSDGLYKFVNVLGTQAPAIAETLGGAIKKAIGGAGEWMKAETEKGMAQLQSRWDSQQAVRQALMTDEEKKLDEFDKRVAEFEANLANTGKFNLADPEQMNKFNALVEQAAAGFQKDIFGTGDQKTIGAFREINLGALDPKALAMSGEKIEKQQLKKLDDILVAIRNMNQRPGLAIIGP
jgi:hypothetical protein